MKVRGFLAIMLITCWFGVVPAAAHDCCHHGQHDADCDDCNHDCDHGAQSGRHCCAWTPSREATDMRTAVGKITEVIYLPGATSDSGMVEVRLQSVGKSQLIRLAPVGFLKQSGFLLREGETVTVVGFPVAGMEGDLLVATELHKGEKTLSLRDPQGRQAW